ncbi:hypothetical protein HDC90_004157 [Pedobacter sp. AK013]|uniref:hypothetical protein n=1 Tax=Pedobacter sp. AK013 TaxID=2723071 RepID=UPI001614F238|nr:hypothetical protein [Pedobacter sp. AK013]MBB6239504.1 hypothetical protein [Pedobacter sp. AK013]
MGNINQLSRNGGLMNQYYYRGNRIDRINKQVALLRADINTGHVMDEKLDLAIKNDQKVYTFLTILKKLYMMQKTSF